MSILVNIQNEIVYLIDLQKENKRRVEKLRRGRVYTEAMKHEMEPFYERAAESILHLNGLLIEAGEIRKHFSEERLLKPAYNFFGSKLQEALMELKKCNYDFKFNKDFRHFVNAYELIQYVRNNLPKAEKATLREREKETLDHYHVQVR